MDYILFFCIGITQDIILMFVIVIMDTYQLSIWCIVVEWKVVYYANMSY